MSANFKSLLTAIAIAVLLVILSVRVIAPKLPPLVGRADVVEERNFVHENPVALRLNGTDGLVTIATGKVDSISGKAIIRAFRRGSTDAEQLKQIVADLVKVSEEPSVLVVQTELGPRAAEFDLFVQYDITVPEGTNVDVTSNNGNVLVGAGCGDVNVAGRNSDINIVEPRGAVNVESVNGRIRLAKAPAGGTLRTVNGDVYAEVAGGSLNASTDNGVIHANLLGADVQEALLTSQNGGVKLRMAGELSASITASALRGSVDTQLAVDTSSGARQPRYLKGVIGTGHARINLDTLNGNILIARSN